MLNYSLSNVKPYRSLSLRTNFGWTFAGNVVYAACQWGVLMVLSKIGTPEMVGRFALGLAVTAPIIILTNLNLRIIQATDAGGEFHFLDYLTLRAATAIFALFVIAVTLIVSGYAYETAIIIFAIGMAKAVESISDVYYGMMQLNERMKYIAISMTIRGTLSLFVFGALVSVTDSVFWGVIGLFIVRVMVLLGYDVPVGNIVASSKRKTSSKYIMERVRKILLSRFFKCANLTTTSLPLGVVMFLISLNTNIPRYFIERYLGERDLGIYSAIVYLMVAGSTIVMALGGSASPRLAKYYLLKEKKKFTRIMYLLVLIGFFLGMGGILVAQFGGEWILRLIYTKEYAEHAYLLPLVMIAATCSYVSALLRYTMTAAKIYRVQLLINLLGTTIIIVFCNLLIPLYGISGAILSLIVGMGFQLVMNVSVNLHLIKNDHWVVT